ncbi:MAG: SDR family oxidoreductase [Arenicellales bacterium]|nr:SDR family oxidoreductase [Arenicellales bacterium]
MSLKHKHVVVVGGGSGIGRAVVEAVVSLRARATISSRNLDKLNTAASEFGDCVAVAPVDMTDEEAVKNWAQKVGAANHLVITASSAAHGQFANLDMAPVRAMFDAKFFGPYLVAREMLPNLSKGGSITFFSGVLSRRPGLNCSGLGAVNSAIEGLTRALALELGPNIRVNCCSPGMVRSDAYAKMENNAREKMYESTGASLPLQKVGETREIAEAVLFLMTNSYTTGVVLDVDGGHMIRQYATR